MPQSKVSWAQIDALRTALVERFPHDQFLGKVLEGVMRAARDKANPIRGNLAASGLREVVGHVLDDLAPETEVRRCVWFVQAHGTRTVTRRQRARYIVHAGLPDTFVGKTLKINVGKSVQPILDAMGALNKVTHVRPATIIRKGRDVRTMTRDVLDGLLRLLDAAAASRDKLKQAIEDVIEDAVFERLIMDTISELDELSTHTVVDDHYIDTVEVKDVDGTKITYAIFGTVAVQLQYGSNADVRSDFGFRLSDSYPYRAIVSSGAGKPLEIDSRDVHISVDTSSFFE